MSAPATEAALKVLEDKYEIVDKLGEGGMGAIYRIRHKLLNELRVVKLIRPQIDLSDSSRERFLREARAAARLRHPRIAQLFDFSVEDDGSSYIIMEHIDGKDLARILEEHGPPSLRLCVEILHQGLQAIEVLHTQGFVHRDVAPDNLMLGRDHQGGPDIRLIDLGIVKATASGDSLGGNTAVGTFVGKARYTAPEQFKDGGSENLKPVSDLYGFGVLGYELLTGTCPIVGKSFADVLSSQLFKPPLPFEESDPDGKIPQDVRELLMSLLQKSPDDRPQTAKEVLARLAKWRPPEQQQDAVAAEVGRLLGDPEPAGVDDATVLLRRDEIQLPEPPTESSSAEKTPVPSPPRASAGDSAVSAVSPADVETQPGTSSTPRADGARAPISASPPSPPAEAPAATRSPASAPSAPAASPPKRATPPRPPQPTGEMETTIHIRRPVRKKGFWAKLKRWLGLRP